MKEEQNSFADAMLERRLLEAYNLPPHERENALRSVYGRTIRYYSSGRVVQWTARMAEQAVKYQLQAWQNSGPYPLVYPIDAWYALYDGKARFLLHPHQLGQRIKDMQKGGNEDA